MTHITGLRSPAGARGSSFFFMQGRPAEARRNGGLVEFALDHVLRAPVVKTEDLVVDVETIHDKTQAVTQADAALGVELEMGIEVIVAGRPSSRGAIASNIRSVVGKPHTHRDAAAVVCGANVPRVRRGTH